MNLSLWTIWCAIAFLALDSHGGSSVLASSTASDLRTLDHSEDHEVKEARIRELLERSEESLPGWTTLSWRRIMAAQLREVPSRMPVGQSLLVMVTAAQDLEVVVMVWAVPDEPRIELVAFRAEWYWDDDEFEANQVGGRVMELVDGEVVFEKKVPLSFSSTQVLSKVALDVIPNASECLCCQRLIHNPFCVELIRIDSTGVLAEGCLSRWDERGFGGLEDILLGLVGMSVDQVRTLESGL